MRHGILMIKANLGNFSFSVIMKKQMKNCYQNLHMKGATALTMPFTTHALKIQQVFRTSC